jgi:hypothetical protein
MCVTNRPLLYGPNLRTGRGVVGAINRQGGAANERALRQAAMLHVIRHGLDVADTVAGAADGKSVTDAVITEVGRLCCCVGFGGTVMHVKQNKRNDRDNYGGHNQDKNVGVTARSSLSLHILQYSLCLTAQELQPRPIVVYGGDFGVDPAEWQKSGTDVVFGQIAALAAVLFEPADP